MRANEEKKNSFVLYYSYGAQFEAMSDKAVAMLIRSIFRYEKQTTATPTEDTKARFDEIKKQAKTVDKESFRKMVEDFEPDFILDDSAYETLKADLPDEAKPTFAGMKESLDANKLKYLTSCLKSNLYGNSGGRPRLS